MSHNISIDSYYRKLLLETVLLPDRESNSTKFYSRLEHFLGSLSNVFDTLSKHSRVDKESSIKRAVAWAKTAQFAKEKLAPSASRYFVSIIYAVRVLRKSFVDREQVKAHLDLRIQTPVYEEGCIEKCLQHASIAESMAKLSGSKRKHEEVEELMQKRRKVHRTFPFYFIFDLNSNKSTANRSFKCFASRVTGGRGFYCSCYPFPSSRFNRDQSNSTKCAATCSFRAFRTSRR